MSKLTMEQQTTNFIESAKYNIPFGLPTNNNNDFHALLNIQKDKTDKKDHEFFRKLLFCQYSHWRF